ncbi:sugar ABC transporter ATP-binding protein [Microbacterium sp. LWH7-1.2]|uniref:sugar ABC transporter ATP-binding protein n=1 Tax=Microbacterium sp. LWH7-1.2 TaxID=3135257 RepID=UPI003138F7AD
MSTEQRVSPSTDVALSARDASKTFGHFRALVGAELTVRRGTVHALLGGNGSGKSTLIKSLAGVYTADAGSLAIGEKSLELPEVSPSVARTLGLRFVHQDLGLFPQLSIAENVALSRGYPTRWSAVQERRMRSEVQDLLDEFDISADPRTRVADLRPSQRSMVAIARALSDAGGSDSILLLDEPTTALGEHDARELMTAIRVRAELGQTIILVSHRFNEISAVADDVTVFRDGRTVGSDSLAQMPLRRVVSLMTGGEGRELPASFLTHAAGATALQVQGLSTGAARDVQLEAGRGEVLGLAGLDGAGHTDVVASLFGAAGPLAGRVTLDGATYAPKTPAQAMRLGAAFIPPDRHADAAFADISVAHNITVSILDRVWNGFALLTGKEKRFASTAITDFAIRAPRPDAPLGVLSGGNQQKVVVGRWFQRSPQLILLVEPTQGVDVVARHDIYTTIAAAAEAGATVLVASSDLDELLAITHRIAVFRAGGVAAVLSTPETTRDEITNAMMAEEPEAA